MFKKLTVILVILMFLFSTIPAFASEHNADVQKQIIYERTINVTDKGGVYQVGFATIKFPAGFIDENRLPVEINVTINSIDGVPGIEFSPDMVDFNEAVTITVHPYKGLLYDTSFGENLKVDLKHQKFTVEHFSRYAFS